MSNWVHIDCVFRLRTGGLDSFLTNEKCYIDNGRKRHLKKFYKAMSKLSRIENCKHGTDRDIIFHINPTFSTKYEQFNGGYSVNYDDSIVCTINGDVRWDSNEDGHFSELIKDIWYNSGLYITSGVCSIVEDYAGSTFMLYNSEYNRITIFRNDLWELEYCSCDRMKLTEDEKTVIIDNKYQYSLEDLFNNSEHYEKEIKEKFDIFIKIVDRWL